MKFQSFVSQQAQVLSSPQVSEIFYITDRLTTGFSWLIHIHQLLVGYWSILVGYSCGIHLNVHKSSIQYPTKLTFSD